MQVYSHRITRMFSSLRKLPSLFSDSLQCIKKINVKEVSRINEKR